MSAKASNHLVSRSCVLDCYTNSKKFSAEFFILFFLYGRRIKGSLVKKHFKLKTFLPKSGYQVRSRKTYLNNVPI